MIDRSILLRQDSRRGSMLCYMHESERLRTNNAQFLEMVDWILVFRIKTSETVKSHFPQVLCNAIPGLWHDGVLYTEKLLTIDEATTFKILE